jgi:hypothetical protein
LCGSPDLYVGHLVAMVVGVRCDPFNLELGVHHPVEPYPGDVVAGSYEKTMARLVERSRAGIDDMILPWRDRCRRNKDAP